MKIYVVVSKQLGELKAHAAFESRDLADAYRGRVWCDHIFDVCQSDFKVLECELFEVDEGPVDLKLWGDGIDGNELLRGGQLLSYYVDVEEPELIEGRDPPDEGP